MLDENLPDYPGGACAHRWHRQRANHRSYYGHALHDAGRSSRSGCRDHCSSEAAKDRSRQEPYAADNGDSLGRKDPFALANILSPGNNEAAGALELIEMLQLKGCVVTMDALHCRRDTAQAIVERGGDYVLAVKDNQPGLLRDAKWVGGVGGLLPWGYPTEPPGGRGWRNVCVGLDAIKKRGYLGWLRLPIAAEAIEP